VKPNKFDRTAFKHQTLQEASPNLEYWKNQSYEKRLEGANYLKVLLIILMSAILRV